MISEHKPERFVLAQFLGGLLTIILTWVSLTIADHVGTPEFVRYIFSPGYVLGMRFAAGAGFLETLGSFGRIAITANMIYYGLISFFILKKINWPRMPRNPRHHFWLNS